LDCLQVGLVAQDDTGSFTERSFVINILEVDLFNPAFPILQNPVFPNTSKLGISQYFKLRNFPLLQNPVFPNTSNSGISQYFKIQLSQFFKIRKIRYFDSFPVDNSSLSLNCWWCDSVHYTGYVYYKLKSQIIFRPQGIKIMIQFFSFAFTEKGRGWREWYSKFTIPINATPLCHQAIHILHTETYYINVCTYQRVRVCIQCLKWHIVLLVNTWHRCIIVSQSCCAKTYTFPVDKVAPNYTIIGTVKATYPNNPYRSIVYQALPAGSPSK